MRRFRPNHTTNQHRRSALGQLLRWSASAAYGRPARSCSGARRRAPPSRSAHAMSTAVPALRETRRLRANVLTARLASCSTLLSARTGVKAGTVAKRLEPDRARHTVPSDHARRGGVGSSGRRGCIRRRSPRSLNLGFGMRFVICERMRDALDLLTPRSAPTG